MPRSWSRSCVNCAQNPGGALVLDLEGLTYISSAGLRVILRLRKEEPEIKLINASREVYEVLDITGFTEMLRVECAYRRVSVDGCELIGEGANGGVYRLDPETIIKVYRNPDSLPDIRRVALDWANFLAPHLPGADAAKLRALIEAVPEDCHMLHGDYHIKNVMLREGALPGAEPEALLIDMDTLSMGHPAFEFASIFLAYVGFDALDPGAAARFFNIPAELGPKLWRGTLRAYFAGRGEAEIDAIKDRAAVLGYARLMRRTMRRGADSERKRKRVELCRQRLLERLARVDALTF